MSTCALCCEETDSWAAGACDHPICLMCSARLRLLCGQQECSVCREKLDRVVVTDAVKPYASLPSYGLKGDRKHGIFFEKTHLQDKYRSLQQNRCAKCRDKPIFRMFSQLRDHYRKTHGLHYCEICTEHLKLFPSEFRLYTRQELTRHRREGDPDNTSYRGHPLCQFCDERFLDNDALHAHLRKMHFWCHFCESEGKQDYYCSYSLLRSHFKSAHFLCEEGACQHEKYTSVFRNKIDLQAHRAAAHSRTVSKAEAKQMRQLDVGFTYTRSEEQRQVGGVSGSGRSQWQQVQKGRGTKTSREREELELASAMSASMQAPQQETRSPQTQKKVKLVTHDKFVHEQPPRMRQKQETRRETEEKEREVEKKEREAKEKEREAEREEDLKKDVPVTQVRKPPGFEGTEPSVTTNSAFENEWPDLSTLSVSAAPKQPPQNTTVSASSLLSRPLPATSRYNPLEPSNFPPLPSTTTSNKYTHPQNSNLKRVKTNAKYPAYSGLESSAIPPGFMEWDRIQQDQIYSAPSAPATTNQATTVIVPGRLKEDYVIDQVRQALNYDREKFNFFRNLSGWYRNSEITVQEYVMRCRQLFGEGMWMAVGPQLAQVMPIESKRRELTQLLEPHSFSSSVFPPTFPSAFPPFDVQATSTWAAAGQPKTNQQNIMRQQTRWGEGQRGGVPDRQNEVEFPTLQSSGLLHPWKARVPV